MRQEFEPRAGASIFWPVFSILAAVALLVAPFIALVGSSWVVVILMTASFYYLVSLGEDWATTHRMEIGGVVVAKGRAAAWAGVSLMVSCMLLEGAGLGLVLWRPV